MSNAAKAPIIFTDNQIREHLLKVQQLLNDGADDKAIIDACAPFNGWELAEAKKNASELKIDVSAETYKIWTETQALVAEKGHSTTLMGHTVSPLNPWAWKSYVSERDENNKPKKYNDIDCPVHIHVAANEMDQRRLMNVVRTIAAAEGPQNSQARAAGLFALNNRYASQWIANPERCTEQSSFETPTLPVSIYSNLGVGKRFADLSAMASGKTVEVLAAQRPDAIISDDMLESFIPQMTKGHAR